jgi:Fe2+ or Zn2+ uptake regulation protein
MQERIAEEHGFTLTHHRLELYGVCRPCRQKSERDDG